MEWLHEWAQTGAIIATGLFALFKAGGFVNRISNGLTRIERRFDEFLDLHEQLEHRVEQLEKGEDNASGRVVPEAIGA